MPDAVGIINLFFARQIRYSKTCFLLGISLRVFGGFFRTALSSYRIRLRCLARHSLVPNFLRTGSPFFERYLSIIGHQSEVRDPPQLRHLRDFSVNEVMIEADLRGVDPRVGKIDAP